MWNANDFTKYSKGGLTQGPTSLNLVQTHMEFGTTPLVMKSSMHVIYMTSQRK
jgi:hypothetical protein